MSSNEENLAAEIFADSGPKHMMEEFGAAGSSSRTTRTGIDWEKGRACLVQGTYVLQSDQTKRRLNTSEALAPAWWESFHFRLFEMLECECECKQCPFSSRGIRCFIYGAIFEYDPPEAAHRRHRSAPRYIVAFRGTMLRDPATAGGDLYLNANVLLNRQHRCSRFLRAREQVEELLGNIANGGGGGGGDVWLAGHSLGASIALDVGRTMAVNSRGYLPTFLFNPPHVSLEPAADVMRMTEKAKTDLRVTGDVLKHALAKIPALRPYKKRAHELFERLSPWAPELYVHERDIICKGFIDYFEQRRKVQERLPRVATSACALSWRDMWHAVIHKDTERPHLLPSAVLWKNASSRTEAHKLRQWWQPERELKLSSKRYSWPGADLE
ncbi:hypothetical protein ACP70R_043690 [Stipagrostis hirtigluma subsp. patula]